MQAMKRFILLLSVTLFVLLTVGCSTEIEKLKGSVLSLDKEIGDVKVSLGALEGNLAANADTIKQMRDENQRGVLNINSEGGAVWIFGLAALVILGYIGLVGYSRYKKWSGIKRAAGNWNDRRVPRR